MKQQLHRNTIKSILGRQAKLTNRLDELQLQVDLLEDDDQLSRTSSRVRDNTILVSCRGNQTRWSTTAAKDDNEDNQLRRNTVHQQGSTANSNQPPAIPHRQRPLFFQNSTAPQSRSKFILNDRQPQSGIQNTGSNQQVGFLLWLRILFSILYTNSFYTHLQ